MTAQRIPWVVAVLCPKYGYHIVVNKFCPNCQYYKGKDEDAESVLCAWEREKQ